jgi:hypothetical protein
MFLVYLMTEYKIFLITSSDVLARKDVLVADPPLNDPSES